MSEREPPGDDADLDELVVASAAQSIALVRRYAVQACLRLGVPDAADTVALLVSEVVTSAVQHASGPEIRVRVLRRGTRLRVAVVHGSPVLPVQRRAQVAGGDGRDLALLEALALAWGVDASISGTTIWFEVAL